MKITTLPGNHKSYQFSLVETLSKPFGIPEFAIDIFDPHLQFVKTTPIYRELHHAIASAKVMVDELVANKIFIAISNELNAKNAMRKAQIELQTATDKLIEAESKYSTLSAIRYNLENGII